MSKNIIIRSNESGTINNVEMKPLLFLSKKNFPWSIW